MKTVCDPSVGPEKVDVRFCDESVPKSDGVEVGA